MRDRDEIVQTAKAIVKQLQPLTNDDTVELLLQRLTTVVGADGEWTDESRPFVLMFAEPLSARRRR